MARTYGARGIDELLSNGDWLRVLASRLVQDDSEVDDLVHEAWVAALDRPAADVRSLPSWLAGVVNNLSRRRLRHQGRHQALRHEQELAIEDSAPGPDEALDRALVRRRVVDAVLALPEPFRSTVLMSFYEGLSSEEIARRAGIPGATVRTRMRRALLRLRSQLESERGRRASGFAGLALLARDAGPSLAPVGPLAGVRMLPAAGLAAAAAILALALLLALDGGGTVGGAAALVPADGARAASRLANADADDACEALAPELLGELRESEIDERGAAGASSSACGGMTTADECSEHAAGGFEPLLPQPALRSERQATAGAGARPEPALLARVDERIDHAAVGMTVTRAAFHGVPRGRGAAPNAQAPSSAGSLPQRARPVPLFRPLPGAGAEEDEEDEGDARAEAGEEHELTSFDGGHPFAARRKVHAESRSTTRSPMAGGAPASHEALERACTCDPRGAEEGAARIAELRPPEDLAGMEPACPLHGELLPEGWALLADEHGTLYFAVLAFSPEPQILAVRALHPDGAAEPASAQPPAR